MHKINTKQQLKVNQLEKIAQALGVRVIDLFTYPAEFVDPKTLQDDERISVTFEVSARHREQLLRMVKDVKNRHSIPSLTIQ